MNVHPEPLLRFPLEFAVALLCVVVAFAFAVYPQELFLAPVHAYALAAICTALALLRSLQGARLLRYQKRLIQRPLYRISEIPSDDRIQQRLFLGRGFRWGQVHVQRLKEARSNSATQYVRRAKFDNGNPLLHGVGLMEKESEVWSSLAERNGHMIVLGATRVGKTRFAELQIGQDIHRGDTVVVIDPKGDLELLQRVYFEAERTGRLDQLRIFHLRYPEHSEKYNPIANYNSPTEIASRLALQLPGGGDSAAFQAFAWRFINSIAVALDVLKITPSFPLVYRYIENAEPLFVQYLEHLFYSQIGWGWQEDVDYLIKSAKQKGKSTYKNLRHCESKTLAMIEFRKINKIKSEVADDLQALLSYDRTYYDKITASLKPLLNKLKTGSHAAMLSPADDEPALDWGTVIDLKQIVYIGLDALANPEVARAVGNTLFADLASTIGMLYANDSPAPPSPAKKKRFLIDVSARLSDLGLRKRKINSSSKKAITIHVDEFNDVVGPHLHPLLSKAGGAGVQITAYTQTLADIEATFGSRAAASRIVGNFNSMVMMRVKTLDTARVFTDTTPHYDVIDLAEGTSVADSSHAESDVQFTSSSNERLSTRSVHSVEPSDVMALPKGEAFAVLDGGTTWKLRIPLIEPVKQYLSAIEMLRRQRMRLTQLASTSP